MDREADSIDSVPVEAWMPNERSRQYLCQSAWPKPHSLLLGVTCGKQTKPIAFRRALAGLACDDLARAVVRRRPERQADNTLLDEGFVIGLAVTKLRQDRPRIRPGLRRRRSWRKRRAVEVKPKRADVEGCIGANLSPEGDRGAGTVTVPRLELLQRLYLDRQRARRPGGAHRLGDGQTLGDRGVLRLDADLAI